VEKHGIFVDPASQSDLYVAEGKVSSMGSLKAWGATFATLEVYRVLVIGKEFELRRVRKPSLEGDRGRFGGCGVGEEKFAFHECNPRVEDSEVLLQEAVHLVACGVAAANIEDGDGYISQTKFECMAMGGIRGNYASGLGAGDAPVGAVLELCFKNKLDSIPQEIDGEVASVGFQCGAQ
jgi:hypothetical protein